MGLAGKEITTGAKYGLAGYSPLKGEPSRMAVILWANALGNLPGLEGVIGGEGPPERRLCPHGVTGDSPSLLFLPQRCDISRLCCVCIYSVRKRKRQLENCLKRDHLLCANLSTQMMWVATPKLPPKCTHLDRWLPFGEGLFCKMLEFVSCWGPRAGCPRMGPSSMEVILN